MLAFYLNYELDSQNIFWGWGWGVESCPTFEVIREFHIYILWHDVDPLLGNAFEISKYTTDVTAPQTSMFPRQQLDTTIMGSAVFYAVRVEML
jgi:hypothetical protein